MPSFCDNQSTSINSSSPEPQMISTEFSDSNIASIKIESSELPNVTQCKPNSEKLNSSSQVLNYTIENLLNSSPSPSSSRASSSSKIDPLSSSKTNTVLQTNLTSSADSANSILSYPAFYDYRRFIPYSDVGHVWKYFFPHNPNVGPGPIRQARGPRRQRTTFTHEQTLRLEMEYHVAEYISRGKRFQLADLLDLTENQIKIWFQNRRAKDKRIEKAIIEQQYRYIAASNLPKQINLSNCSTCSYTKHQFESSSVSSNITNDSKRNDHLIENNLKVESE